MTCQSNICLWLIGPLGAFLLAGAVSGAPEPAVTRAPGTRVQGYRIVVEKVIQSQTVRRQFGRDGVPDADSGEQRVYVTLAVYPPKPELLAHIDGVETGVTAGVGPDTRIRFQSYLPDEPTGTGARVWRTLLTAMDVPLAVSQLEGLRGRLMVYPSSRRVRLDFPLSMPVPQTLEAGELRATLREVRTRDGALSAVISTEWPVGVNIARVDPEAPSGVSVITPAGAAVTPYSDSGSPSVRGAVMRRQIQVSFTDLREPAGALRLEVDMRSGKPAYLPFTLPDIILPDALPTAAEPPSGELPGDLEPGHAFFAVTGGTLEVLLPAPGEGTLYMGLSRRGAAGYGPWRWVELQGGPGVTSVGRLLPGRYRAGLRRGGAPAAQPREIVEVEILPERTVRLPGPGRGR